MKKILSLLLIISMLVASCQEAPKEKKMDKQTEPIENINRESPSLQSVLDEKKAGWADRATDETKTLYADGIESVVESGILKTAKQKGDQAPDFTLQNAIGEDVSLSEYLAKGPVVLTWYRGGWCPYCNLTLHHLQQALPNFKAAGANLIALTPELPDQSISTKDKHALTFEVLTDQGNNVAREYGIVFKLIDPLADKYQQSFDLHGYNGDESNELPLAATYVIDTDGTIKYAFLDAEYRNRAEPADILAVLQGL